MSAAEPPAGAAFRRDAWERALVVAIGLGGLLMAHHPMLLSGLRRIQWDLGDTRFVVFLLEHGYRWLMRYPHHEHFWDPPIFYPAGNTAAYAETMLSVGPFYWPWRWLGLPMDTAFQWWLLTVSALNFASAYLFLRRCAGAGRVPSAMGAFLFSFGASRINQIGHHQLVPHFYTVAALYSLCRVLSPPPGQMPRRATLHVFAFAASTVLQLYAGIYFGWFLGLMLGLGAVVALALPRCRPLLLGALRRHLVALPVAAALSAVCLWPLASHYFAASREVGFRHFGEVAGMLPKLDSWLDLGPYSWLFWRTAQSDLVRRLPIEWEQRIGLGVLTPLLGIAGLWIERRRPLVQVTALVSVALLLLSTNFDSWTAWRWVYELVPAGKAIRTVCRIGILALIPMAVGLAAATHRLAERRRWGLLLALFGVSALEQGLTTPAFDKYLHRQSLAGLAAQIDPTCEAFYFSPVLGRLPEWKYNLDAMWLALDRQVPTLNGYSGNFPPGWGLSTSRVDSTGDERRLAAALEGWRRQSGGRLGQVCWLRARPDDGRNDARFVAQDVPKVMKAGRPYRVGVTFRNTGTAVWTPPMVYRLGAAEAGITWGTNRVDVPQYVDPGTEVTFLFNIRAPSRPGTYRFQWQLVMEWREWFGELSAPVDIEVQAP